VTLSISVVIHQTLIVVLQSIVISSLAYQPGVVDVSINQQLGQGKIIAVKASRNSPVYPPLLPYAFKNYFFIQRSRAVSIRRVRIISWRAKPWFSIVLPGKIHPDFFNRIFKSIRGN